MKTLYQKFETLLQNTTTDFKRYLYEKSRGIGDQSNVSNIRETFFFNQMSVKNIAKSSKSADFVMDHYAFEASGKSKQKRKQDCQLYVVSDDI